MSPCRLLDSRDKHEKFTGLIELAAAIHTCKYVGKKYMKVSNRRVYNDMWMTTVLK